MSKLSFTAGLASIVLAILSTQSVASQKLMELNFVAKLADYYDIVYGPSPVSPARHVFFEGEPIGLTIEFGNSGESPVVFRRTQTIGKAFVTIVVRAPESASALSVVPEDVGRVRQNGLTFDSKWRDTTDLAPGGVIRWNASLMGVRGTGFYEVRVVPEVVAEDVTVRPQGTVIRFELRSRNQPAVAAELARRRMMRSFYSGSDAETEREANHLLEVYPVSAAALEMKGYLAQRAGRDAEAAATFERALQLVASGGDWLLIRHRPRNEIDAIVAHLQRAAK